MNYCKKCVQPDTRPGIELSKAGVCNACIGSEEKVKKIDWVKRRRELENILKKFRSKNSSYYDCIVPVSGGKDSTYQVYMVKNVLKMNPLTVTYRYADRTRLGQKNLDNLRRLGVDHIEISPNPEVEKKFISKTFVKLGDPCIPDHMGIFAVALRVAINYKIPLIIWGENPQLEYGGTAGDRNNPFLDAKWLEEHGTLQGTMAEDWVDEDLSLNDLFIYRFPKQNELVKAKLSSIFLGYYLPWDPVDNYKIAKRVGFKKSSIGPKMGLYDFADLDSTNMVIHHYIKWLKFGMTRLNDHISVEIRNGRMARSEGIKILKIKPERIPLNEIKIFCKYLEMKEKEFWDVLERFRNHKIWKKDKTGNWYIPDYLEDI